MAVNNAYVIKKEEQSVRIMMIDNKVMFAACDILGICGYRRHTDKKRKMYDDPNYPGTVVKAGYPFRNSRGMRKMPMYFIDEIAARAVIDGADVGADTRKWLLQEVLTYKPFPEEPAVSPPEQKVAEREGTTYDEMNRMIDRVLIELLELKKLASLTK